ncbi:hypothetical protein BJX96DRAFT_145668, partial [Aspergillus floccosus]
MNLERGDYALRKTRGNFGVCHGSQLGLLILLLFIPSPVPQFCSVPELSGVNRNRV